MPCSARCFGEQHARFDVHLDFEPLRHTLSPLYWARGVATGLKVKKCDVASMDSG